MRNTAPAIPRLGVPAYDYWNECLHGVARAGVARTVNVENSAGAIDDLALTGAITNVPTLTKTGAGKLLIDTVLGTGATTLNATQGETHLAQSQTLTALNISDGAIVTLADVPPFSPAPGFAAVPEPGALSLLALGALALLRRRR